MRLQTHRPAQNPRPAGMFARFTDTDYDRYAPRRTPAGYILPNVPLSHVIPMYAAIAQRGATTVGTGTSSATANKPTGVVDNDVLMLQVISDGNTLTNIAGWGNSIHDGTSANNGKKCSLFLKKAASEGASYTVTPGAASTTEIMITAFSGVDTTTMLDCASVEGSAITNITYTTIGPTASANAVHVIALFDWTNVTGTSTPSTYTLGGTSTTRLKSFFKTIASSGTTVSGVTSTGGGGDGYQVGIMLKAAGAAGPSITGGTANPVHGSTGNTVTGSGFGASQGAGSYAIGGQAQTITAWADTTITYTAVRGVNLDNVAVNGVVTDNGGTPSNNYALTGFAPPAGWQDVVLTSVWAVAAERVQSALDLAIGNHIEWNDTAGATVDASGRIFWPLTITPPHTFDARVGVTGDGYGSSAVQTLTDGAGTARAPHRVRIGIGIGL